MSLLFVKVTSGPQMRLNLDSFLSHPASNGEKSYDNLFHEWRMEMTGRLCDMVECPRSGIRCSTVKENAWVAIKWTIYNTRCCRGDFFFVCLCRELSRFWNATRFGLIHIFWRNKASISGRLSSILCKVCDLTNDVDNF